MTEADRQHLLAFRAAARQVREASPIANGKSIRIRGEVQPPGSDAPIKVTAELLASEPFRSLALSVRLVYQSGEPANFGHICNIIERYASDELRTAERDLRTRYEGALTRHNPLLVVLRLVRPELYTPREMFETWLYHGVFHQDISLQADYESLTGLGDTFPYTVQGIVLQLAGRILDLDDIVADLLAGAKLPRIGE
jgi:hypothetical protein